ncbi:hypothetical protein J3R30DRAFT_2266991 [Lentinula aciculospora]|uniref:Vacuolar ATPase assembly integral membrane protein VMA21 n=1 Tax=Lentinula aciculospora TaxID=153920 RepID=A0A9W9DF48_9AGAR|nr:hypothetical protein J3R30DRAFT_2266991 [Lentinula aciculospora]
MSTSEQVIIGKLNTDAASTYVNILAGNLRTLVTLSRQWNALQAGRFSLSLGIVPLTLYYGSLHYLWNGNSTFAAITAIVAANIVLIAYIILSILEDKQSPQSPSRIYAKALESKKAR